MHVNACVCGGGGDVSVCVWGRGHVSVCVGGGACECVCTI